MGRKGKNTVAVVEEEGASTTKLIEQLIKAQMEASARQDAVLEELRQGREATRRLEEAMEAQRRETALRFEELEALAKIGGGNGGRTGEGGVVGHDDVEDGGNGGAIGGENAAVGGRGAHGGTSQGEEAPSGLARRGAPAAPPSIAPSVDSDYSPRLSTRSMSGSWEARENRFDLARHAKLELDSFKGEVDPEILTNWLLKLAQYFEIHEVPDYAKLKIMETKLEGHALIWWQFLKSAAHFSPPTWADFERLVKRKFMPFDVEGQLFRDLQNLKQGGLSVKEYMERLLALSTRMCLQEEESAQVMRFLNGLNYTIQREVELLELNTLDRAYQVALKVEARTRKGKEAQRGGGQASRPAYPKGGHANAQGGGGGSKDGQGVGNAHKPQGSSTKGGGRGTASYRGRGGGNAAQSRGSGRGSNQVGTQGAKPPIVCYECNEEGHKSFECPKRASNRLQAAQPAT